MSENIKKERNYWPHSIVAGIIFIIIACIVTIKIALDNPVQMDSFYLEKYQSVDRNINDIMKAQKEFEKSYVLEYQTKKFSMNKANTFTFTIKNLETKSNVQKADIKLVITRPETNEFNQEFVLQASKGGVFTVEGIKAEKPGRWQILTKINIGEKSSFNKYEVFAN